MARQGLDGCTCGEITDTGAHRPRCPWGIQQSMDDDLIDYARSQWDGRAEGPRTEYDE